MSRKHRLLSASNIYHIILRGVNRQQIFEEPADNYHFISTLERYSEICGFYVIAYCLMGNHLHLLLETCDTPLPKVMQRLELSFIYWYNRKYDRTGPLFEGRYRSFPVETERQLLRVFHYIHNNPIRAGITDSVFSYPWSSANAYNSFNHSFINTDKITQLFSSQIDLINYLNTPAKASDLVACLNPRQINDSLVVQLLLELSSCKTISHFQRLNIQQRNTIIRKLAEMSIPQAQIARLIGLSKTHISRIIQAIDLFHNDHAQFPNNTYLYALNQRTDLNMQGTKNLDEFSQFQNPPPVNK